jgi:TonB family protein
MRSRLAPLFLLPSFLLSVFLPAICLSPTCLVPVALAQDASAQPNHDIPPADASKSLISKVNPVYPPLARQARIQGTVVMKVAIGTSGDIQHIQLVSGHPMLAPAAIEAVKQWKYQPFVIDGEPANVTTTVQVNFTLAESMPPGGVPAPDSGFVRVSEGVMRSMRTENAFPEYPPVALQQQIQGQVLLQVKISASGEVESINLISGHPLFAPPTVEAVRLWKYRPYVEWGSSGSRDVCERELHNFRRSGISG